MSLFVYDSDVLINTNVKFWSIFTSLPRKLAQKNLAMAIFLFLIFFHLWAQHHFRVVPFTKPHDPDGRSSQNQVPHLWRQGHGVTATANAHLIFPAITNNKNVHYPSHSPILLIPWGHHQLRTHPPNFPNPQLPSEFTVSLMPSLGSPSSNRLETVILVSCLYASV